MASPLDKLTIPRELVFEFFATFARMEYSLKVVPRFRQPGNGDAKADWASFAIEIAPAFAPAGDQRLRDALQYLLVPGLRYYSVLDDVLDWRPFPVVGDSEALRTIRLIKQLRNNLFHGAKFALDPNSDPDRERKLVESATLLLHHMLALSGDVRAVYEN
jgi:hypothetical protein